MTFTVTVSPVSMVYGCKEKQDQEERGMFGFHLFATCPNCQVVPLGWEMWGENGHRQGSALTRERLVHWIKVTARKQWRTQGGQVMGYRFNVGSTIYYRGGSS